MAEIIKNFEENKETIISVCDSLMNAYGDITFTWNCKGEEKNMPLFSSDSRKREYFMRIAELIVANMTGEIKSKKHSQLIEKVYQLTATKGEVRDLHDYCSNLIYAHRYREKTQEKNKTEVREKKKEVKKTKPSVSVEDNLSKIVENLITKIGLNKTIEKFQETVEGLEKRREECLALLFGPNQQ